MDQLISSGELMTIAVESLPLIATLLIVLCLVRKDQRSFRDE